MKNIPVFTAAAGVATLILAEIPHKQIAYILIRSVWTDAAALLEECSRFCRMAGAETVYASWEDRTLPGEPAYDMLSMTCRKADLPAPAAPVELVALTPENGPDYLSIYQQCFRSVPGAATYTHRDLARLYDTDMAWLARKDGCFAAIAEISREGLEGIGVLPEFRGLGFDLAAAVLRMVPSLTVSLKVASTNAPALRLYGRLGFTAGPVISRWFRV